MTPYPTFLCYSFSFIDISGIKFNFFPKSTRSIESKKTTSSFVNKNLPSLEFMSTNKHEPFQDIEKFYLNYNILDLVSYLNLD